MPSLELIAAVTTLALINERVIEALTRPLFENLPAAKAWGWALMYLAFSTGLALGWISGLNLFVSLLPDSLAAGRLITSAAIGLGSSFLHELLPSPVKLDAQNLAPLVSVQAAPADPKV